MYKDKKIIYIKALTPVHSGAGDGLASVDMPIQREKHSNIPKIEASSLKGSIKHIIYNKIKAESIAKHKSVIKEDYKANFEELYTIFGPEDEEENYASAIGFTDAKLLLFPIRSSSDIFKLITCPYIIERFEEELELLGTKFTEKQKKIIENITINDGECISIKDNLPKDDSKEDHRLVLEEYIFEKVKYDCTELISLFKNIDQLDMDRIVILNNTDFIDLVTMYTEIITRNKIDVSTGAAKDTGLFTEEYLPSETIMYFMVLGAPSFNKKNNKTSEEVLEYFKNNVDEVFQVGGDATIGKGFVKMLNKVGE